MRINLKHLWQKLLMLLRLSPLSLAKKCRLTFGAAVVFILTIALLLPYIWMGQLIKKNLLDTGRARSQALFDRHFQLKDAGETSLEPLDNTGQVVDVNNPEMRWISFTKDDETDFSQLTEEAKEMVESLKADQTRNDTILLRKEDGVLHSNYVRIFRATDHCISCHNPQGSALKRAFSLNEMIGAIVIQSGDLGSEIRDTKLMNLLFIFVAGLIGGIGATRYQKRNKNRRRI